MSAGGERRGVFSAAEWRVFGLHVLIVVGIAAGMWAVAPSRAGRWAGVMMAAALLPVPPLVIYGLRRWRK